MTLNEESEAGGVKISNTEMLFQKRWLVEENVWDPARNEVWETLCMLGNGYIGVRGFPEEPFDAGPTHPGVYPAGVFNPGADGISEMVNVPNFLAVEITLGGQPFRMTPEKITEYNRTLDLKRGLLLRSMVYTDGDRSTRLEFERFVSMSDMHLAGQSIAITPLNWSGKVDVKLWLDVRKSSLPKHHLKVVRSGHIGRNGLLVATQTKATRIRIALACQCSASVDHGSPVKPKPIGKGERVGVEFTATMKCGQRATLERMVSVWTSREADAESIERACVKDVKGSDYEQALRKHIQAWQKRWMHMDIEIDGPEEDQLAIRFAIFQLSQHAPPHDAPVSIAAKGLAGEGYRGHIFWDTEIFMLPFFVGMDPQAARRLLSYRTATIEGARRKARAQGYKGAMFAWESTDTGDETCPPIFHDHKTGADIPILTGLLQNHVSADVVYAAWQYVQTTGDSAFREHEFLMLAVETARFWESRVAFNQARNRYDIRNIIGPDEYHYEVDNNAFTNYIATWNLRMAVQEVARIQRKQSSNAILRKLAVSEDETRRWKAIADAMCLPKPSAKGVWEQHEGFSKLRNENAKSWSFMTSKVPEDQRLAELNKAQVLKQADILMLSVMFANEFPKKWQRANWDYYEPRTTHDSSLSPSVHSIAASHLGLSVEAYDYFRRSALLDLNGSMGNTNSGLHMAGIGGTWQAVVFGFMGVDLTGGKPKINPKLPKKWKRVTMQIQHRGRWYRLEASSGGRHVIARSATR